MKTLKKEPTEKILILTKNEIAHLNIVLNEYCDVHEDEKNTRYMAMVRQLKHDLEMV